MRIQVHLLVLSVLLLGAVPVKSQTPAKPVPAAVDIVGKATEFFFTRNYNSYYWREDFSFLLTDEKTGKVWRILSREPTPAYDWRMGTTFTGLKPDWKAEPRVRIVGVTGVDRLPATFYDFKLEEANTATTHLVWVEMPKDGWQLYNANNWFHKWSERADPVIYSHYADQAAPYDIYGFINGQSAPFSKRSQKLIEQAKGARMFHGLIRTVKQQAFGYEIEVLHLVGPDKGGNAVAFYGDTKTLPLLEKKR